MGRTLVITNVHQADGHNTAVEGAKPLPESIPRLPAILSGIDDWEQEHPDLASRLVKREDPRPATMDEMRRCHKTSYLKRLWATMDEVRSSGKSRMGERGDIAYAPGTKDAVLTAAGAVVEATQAVMKGSVSNAFCVVRPPGHHASAATEGGYCFVNNALVGAMEALSNGSAKKVAVLDWDIHHGQGSSGICAPNEALLYASTHQMPLYPGTGPKEEKGMANNLIHVPLARKDKGAVLLEAWRETILPQVEAFHPDLIVVSTGFDGHTRDFASGTAFEEEDYTELMVDILKLASRICQGRVVSVLEGGYTMSALTECAAGHIGALVTAGLALDESDGAGADMTIATSPKTLGLPEEGVTSPVLPSPSMVPNVSPGA